MENVDGKFAQEQKRVVDERTRSTLDSIKLKKPIDRLAVQSLVDMAFEVGRFVEAKEILTPKPSWLSKLFDL